MSFVGRHWKATTTLAQALLDDEACLACVTVEVISCLVELPGRQPWGVPSC